MNAVDWDESLSVGDAHIDAQHKYMIQLAGTLAKALENGQANLVAHEALNALDAYTKQHFKDEEELMQRLGYVDLDLHRKKHASLLMDVQNLKGQMIARMPNIGEYVIKWVQKCLVPHILGADMRALKGVQAPQQDS